MTFEILILALSPLSQVVYFAANTRSEWLVTSTRDRNERDAWERGRCLTFWPTVTWRNNGLLEETTCILIHLSHESPLLLSRIQAFNELFWPSTITQPFPHLSPLPSKTHRSHYVVRFGWLINCTTFVDVSSMQISRAFLRNFIFVQMTTWYRWQGFKP